jgi:hypothetical protein
MRYAAQTSVSSDRSRAEIEALLRKHGATGFVYGWQDEGGKALARIEFLMKTRHLRFTVVLPDLMDFSRTPGGRRMRRPDDCHRAWEQACRSSWRALLLIIKAKLEAIAVGVSVFDQEFLAFVVMQDGKTIGDLVIPQLTTGRVKLLRDTN